MKRRSLIKWTAAASLGVVAPSAGIIWLQGTDQAEQLALDDMLSTIANLKTAKVEYFGEWNPTQIFNHIAQSIEFSMSGYPEHKSEIFKRSIGQVAFAVFQRNGKMTHNLSEGIPGAPAINQPNLLKAALERVEKAIEQFVNFDGSFKPHFAYGELTKSEYLAAHLMHFNNHMEEVRI